MKSQKIISFSKLTGIFSVIHIAISLQVFAVYGQNSNEQICYRLRVNGSENPMGIDDERFRLSWILPTRSEVDRFQVIAGIDPETLNQKENLFWNSGERKAADNF